ncbi:MAG: transglutaminase domain-containing protein [Methanobacteriota archaeon]|nr:MAG: transglutaminase domain-containing protein [Euryarchaeota archaeon]
MSAPVDELTQQATMAEEGAAAEQLAPEGDTELAELIAASSVPPVPVLTTCLAGALSALAAAWLVSGLFRGFEARAIAISAVLIGTGLVYVSVRFSRPRLQYLLLPIALIMGAILVAPDARQGVASMPALVLDALRSGGILQPPIDFEPGWRLVLTAVFTMLCGGSCALGLALEKPRAAASGSFETRRLLRSGALAAGLVAAVFVLNQFGFFFPQANREHVDPPQRPRVPPPAPDVPLFAVKMDQKVPLRLGVIDVYKDGAFMLPPQDTRRLDRLNPPARLAARAKGEPPPAGAPQKTFTADITVEQATGHLLPDLAWSRSVGGREVPIVYDPRTNTLKLSGRPLYSGLHYTITAGVPPDGRALAKGGPLPAEAKQYLEAPPVPLEVKTILDKAPENPFDRLQAVRNALYLHVVAAGTGQPTDVSAQRVVQMLQGGQANPYEITAAEALLGRWAGIPSRIGYGYFGGADKGNGVNEIRPKHGSTWLEAAKEPAQHRRHGSVRAGGLSAGPHPHASAPVCHRPLLPGPRDPGSAPACADGRYLSGFRKRAAAEKAIRLGTAAERARPHRRRIRRVQGPRARPRHR